jgi:opacity protein-like surface antigen
MGIFNYERMVTMAWSSHWSNGFTVRRRARGSGNSRLTIKCCDLHRATADPRLAVGENRSSSGGAVENSFELGWTAGVGLEVALAGNWIGKVEYLYVTFPQGLPCPTTCVGSVSLNENLIRIGINYKFKNLGW